MAPSPFRSAAVVCGIVTASLGVGLLTPVTATAATASASPSPTASAPAGDASTNEYPEFVDIPIDASLTQIELLQDWSMPYAARVFAGYSNGDDIWLMLGDTVVDRSNWGAAFFISVPDALKDQNLEIVRIHTAEDGTRTRSDRMPMPRGITVDGLQRKNHFDPGVTQLAGSATAGATVVATDSESGDELFTTKVSTTRSGTGTWSADAELSDREHKITLTQTTPEGRTNELRDIRFTPGEADAPDAPTLQTAERRLDGDFVLSGQFDAATDSIIVEDEAGEKIVTAALTSNGYVANIPQDRLGTTVHVVALSDNGTPSLRTAAPLEQVDTDASIAAPTLRDVKVYPDGRVQVIGEREDSAGVWILDGDRVVRGIERQEGWSYTIPAAETDKQLDIVNLSMEGRRFDAVSERVHLPRLLQVEDLATENTYQPGTRAFTGTAEAGATITATDQDGNELFETKATSTRSGTGTWNADADLTATTGYKVTFTQTTTDGRTSVMPDIAFTADAPAPADLTVTSHTADGTFTPGPQVFEGTATPGATITMNPFGFVDRYADYELTTTADTTTGKWQIERGLADTPYTAVAFKQTPHDGVVNELRNFALHPEQIVETGADLVLTTPGTTFTPGTTQTFTGTATPGTLITLYPFSDDPRYTSYALTTTANTTTGAWTITRALANQPYPVVITQQDGTNKIKRITHTMQPTT
ncbi:hypothetical protein EDF63_0248 [Curtobacterium sp. JUb34]|uniref:hypothetical protein n=1 Tax=Curtobacterium sp. JUb34 TaxID=2485109 RepID=UPI000FB04C7C|nr:hypothetical protein [Curtobacterium sp. JUb34]ROR36132.1 hypothetical protein EDF63_0248 [Curtobacterium sp. JUb34]